ncbi:MAG: putative zinc-binding metallopeptidase, partial [Gemmatimonadota bacterium]
MKRFECECGQRVYFDNTMCLACGQPLGFDPERLEMLRLRPSGDNRFDTGLASPSKRCRNALDHGSCNWLLSADDPSEFCVACRTTRTIPDLQRQDNFLLWVRMEQWKRRLLYTLLDLGLVSVSGGGGPWPSFRFLEDQRRNPNVTEMFVSTGHKDGVITINLSEADDV